MNEGANLAALSTLPPVRWVLKPQPGNSTSTHLVETQILGIAEKAPKGEPKQFRHVPLHRAVVVRDSPFTFTCLVGADAAFLFSLLGISVQGNTSNMYLVQHGDKGGQQVPLLEHRCDVCALNSSPACILHVH